MTLFMVFAASQNSQAQCAPDVVLPSIICPSNLTVNPLAGECTATVPDLIPVVTDNCPAPTSWVSNAPAGNIFPAGLTTVTFTATDGAGNTQSCQTKVTVQGAGWYNIVCNADVTIPADPSGVTTLLPEVILATSTPCLSYQISLAGMSPAPFIEIPGSGTFQVSAHVSLPGGGYNTCWGNVVITGSGNCTDDQLAPTILCPPSVTINTNSSLCTAHVPLGSPAVYDNCPGPIQIISTESPDEQYPVGTTTVVFTATDAAGNSQNCQTTVQVNPGTQVAAIACNDHITVTLGPDGTVEVTPEDVLEGGPYDCGNPQIALQGGDFSEVLTINSGGSFVVICRVLTPSGNYNTCWGTVEVLATCTPDVTPPTCIAPPDLTFTASGFEALGLNLQDSLQMVALLGAVEASDFCTPTSDILLYSTYSLVTYSDGSIKEITRTFLALDAGGNAGTDVQKIWIEPQETPQMHLPAWRVPENSATDSLWVQSGGDIQLASSYNDEVFYAACTGALSRRIRYYSVFNWNVSNPAVPFFQLPALDMNNDGIAGDAYQLTFLNDGWWLTENGQITQWIAPIAGVYEYVQQMRYNYLDTSSQKIVGLVYLDQNENCSANIGDTPLAQWKVKGIGRVSNRLYEAVTNGVGYYELAVCPDDTLVEVSLDVPYVYHPSCPTIFDVPVNAGGQVQQPIAVRLVEDCPLLSVTLATQRIRPCVSGTYRVSYCNMSDQAVANTVVEVTLDSLLTYTGASISGVPLGNQRYGFNLGNLPAGNCGAFDLHFMPDCNAPVGLTHCSTAQIFPDTTCDVLWSGAVLRASGQCEGDSIQLKIENIGEADMSAEQNSVVIEDLIMYMSTPFQLNAGDEITFMVPATGATWRIETQQEPGYPWGSLVAAFVEGCGGLNNPEAALSFPPASNDPFHAEDCTVSVSSYDPNDKQAVPTGYGAGHIIRSGSDLSYTIRFQNEGTDTAYTVVVLDSLSDRLQADYINRLAASHPFDFDVLGGHILRFRFDHILLPPKSVNEAASQGFIRFNIPQHEDNAPGDQITNRAAIYFDINAPVLTNTTVHTIGAPFQTVSTVDPTLGAVRVYPQPAQDVVYLEFGEHLDEATMTLTNTLGKVVRVIPIRGSSSRLEGRGIPAGCYYYQITSSDGRSAAGKILLADHIR